MDLKPWQKTGAAWLARRRCALLADEMRVGKTATAVEAAALVGALRVLVLCPPVAVRTWELAFSPRSTVVTRTGTQLRNARSKPGPLVLTTSYGLIPPGEAEPWDLVILDEAHYLRNRTAKRTKAVYGKDGAVRRAARVWALTGTPMVNNASELWPMLRVFGVYAEPYEKFVREFCTGYLGPYGYVITGNKNSEKLRQLLAPVMLRRTLADVAPEVPAITYVAVPVDGAGFVAPPPDIRLVEAALAQDDPAQALELVAPSVATLRRFVGQFKAIPAADMLREELQAGTHKVVVFAIHVDVVATLAAQLEAFKPVVYSGNTSKSLRDAAVHRFQSDPSCRVFIGNIISAGTAIDLSVANEVVFVESDWVPGNNAQAAMRVQNFNKRTPVMARLLSAGGTLDERVQEVLARKTEDFTRLFGDNCGSKAAYV